MTQEINSWIFLVSANRYLDYRTVIAPDFVCEAKKTGLLSRYAGSDLISQKIAYVSDATLGNLTLVFRVMEAIAEELEIEGQGVLKDSFGREIYLIEGLVFKGKIQEFQLSKDGFDNIHNQIKTDYQEFWKLTTSQLPNPSRSEKFSGEISFCKEAIADRIDDIANGVREAKEEVDELYSSDSEKKNLFSRNLSITILFAFIFILILMIFLIVKIVF